MRRVRSPLSLIHSAIGSITHWTFRALLRFVFNKAGIYVHPKIEFWIAYLLTAATLIAVGIWGTFRIFGFRIPVGG